MRIFQVCAAVWLAGCRARSGLMRTRLCQNALGAMVPGLSRALSARVGATEMSAAAAAVGRGVQCALVVAAAARRNPSAKKFTSATGCEFNVVW